jgi:hypothetical protein
MWIGVLAAFKARQKVFRQRLMGHTGKNTVLAGDEAGKHSSEDSHSGCTA